MKSSDSNSDKYLHNADNKMNAYMDYSSASSAAKSMEHVSDAKKKRYERIKFFDKIMPEAEASNFSKGTSNFPVLRAINEAKNNKKIKRIELTAHQTLRGSKDIAKKYLTPANINKAGVKVSSYIPENHIWLKRIAKHSGFIFSGTQKLCIFMKKHHDNKKYHRYLHVADDLLYGIHSSNKALVKNDTKQLQNVISRINRPSKSSAKLTTQGLLAFHNDNQLGDLYYIGNATRMITQLSSIRNINNRSNQITEVSEDWSKGNMLNKLAKGFTQLNSVDRTSAFHIEENGYQKQIDQDKDIANYKKHIVDVDVRNQDPAIKHEMYNVIDKNRIKLDAVDSTYVRNYHKAINGKFKKPTFKDTKAVEETQLRQNHLDTPLKRSSYEKEQKIEDLYGMRNASGEKDYRARLHKAINLYGVKYAPENSRDNIIHYHSFSINQTISSDRNKSLVNNRQFRPASLNNSMANHSASLNANSASSSSSSLTAEQIRKYRLTHGGPTR